MTGFACAYFFIGWIDCLAACITRFCTNYTFQFFIGGRTYQLPGASPAPIQLGPIQLSYIDLISMGVSIVVILGVAYFLLGTRIGKATRAISDNPQLAATTFEAASMDA